MSHALLPHTATLHPPLLYTRARGPHRATTVAITITTIDRPLESTTCVVTLAGMAHSSRAITERIGTIASGTTTLHLATLIHTPVAPDTSCRELAAPLTPYGGDPLT